MLDRIIRALVGRCIVAYLPIVVAVQRQLEALGILPVQWTSIKEGD